MRFLPPAPVERRSLADLTAFFAGCREEVRRSGSPLVASVSLRAPHLDPLAVLAAVDEPGTPHFYWEQPATDRALAGFGAVCWEEFTGADRWSRARDWASERLSRAIVCGDTESPFAGPHALLAFSFSDQPRQTAAFASSVIFIPRWMVSQDGSGYLATANAWIEQDTDPEQVAARIWQAHRKFSVFDYTKVPVPSQGGFHTLPAPSAPVASEAGPPGGFASAVTRAVAEIAEGRYAKVVLARALDLVASHDFDPLETLARLRERFPNCHSFSFRAHGAASFIGATPERLVRLADGQGRTEAIAGSAPRGANAAEDAALASGLLGSDKDRREHAFVRDSILRRLSAIGLGAQPDPTPRLLRLPNVQHLHTPVTFPVPTGTHLLDLAAALHPTPAVGGSPRGPAAEAIQRLEPFPRGLYAGAVGWFNHQGEGELVVAIRSALVEGRHARVYAGAGIVPGSDPAKEERETALKMQAMLAALT